MNYLLQFFHYKHLDEPMKAVAQRFHDMAWMLNDCLPDCPEKTETIRKLLESRDSAERAIRWKDTIVRPQTLTVEAQIEAS